MSVRFVQKKTDQVFDTQYCLQGLNLLGHAQLIELDLGSQCGGKGRCGKDRVFLPSVSRDRINAPTEVERVHLSKEQLEAGYRLACQVFPAQDDLDIEVSY